VAARVTKLMFGVVAIVIAIVVPVEGAGEGGARS